MNGILLAIGGVAAAVGIGLILFVQNRRPPHALTAFIGLAFVVILPVVVLFGLFPDSSSEGSLLGFKVTGAFAAYVAVLVWATKRNDGWLETKRDTQIRELETELVGLEEQLSGAKDSLSLAKQEWIKETEVHEYDVDGTESRFGFVTGDLKNVRDIDIWVNPENTLMEMARRHEKNISAIIRHLGGTDESNHYSDSIGTMLSEQVQTLGGRVNPGDVLATDSGALERKGVRKILHVAAVQAAPGKGFSPIQDVHECVTAVLDKAEGLGDSGAEPCRSILIPLMGTGDGGGDLRDLAPTQVKLAVSWLAGRPESRVNRVYFLTGTYEQLRLCQEAAEGLESLHRSSAVTSA